MSAGKIVFEGRKFHVERGEFDLGGRTQVFDIVVHPGSAVVLPLLADQRVVLIRNWRAPVRGELLELPAGTLDAGESPENCAARELAEETGYRAGRLEPLVSFYSTPGILTERMHSFVATELTSGSVARDSSEQICVVPMTYSDVLEAIRDGRIVDGKTILTLLYYDRFVRRGAGGQ